MSSSLINFVKYSPVIIVLLGVFLLGAFSLKNSPVYIQAAFTRVHQPNDYSFKSYDKLLRKYVKDGLVDYKNLKSSPLLNDSLNELSGMSPDKLSKDAKLAYWINAYNLLVIKVIADHYPINKIHEVGVDRSSKKFVVGGKVYSSQSILSDQLQPRIDKYRAVPEVVFLICGGTLNYPPLTDHAITVKSLEIDAKVAAYKFITNKKNVYFDKNRGVMYLSSLFKNYESTFASAGHSPYSFTTLYLSPGDIPDLKDIMVTRSYFSKVDYRINDKAAFRPRRKKVINANNKQKAKGKKAIESRK